MAWGEESKWKKSKKVEKEQSFKGRRSRGGLYVDGRRRRSKIRGDIRRKKKGVEVCHCRSYSKTQRLTLFLYLSSWDTHHSESGCLLPSLVAGLKVSSLAIGHRLLTILAHIGASATPLIILLSPSLTQVSLESSTLSLKDIGNEGESCKSDSFTIKSLLFSFNPKRTSRIDCSLIVALKIHLLIRC